ncbi:glycosyl transferase family protein 1 [Thermococcus cleftensis]|uniref:Glycosyl transferase family protein 1 n=1 Tax=Thermococcus cleftensis (strain DSM 27260 / KACC 17922 / CL1) TaxID=163003 RepID=I3ZS00_THECF|nr:glycosyltransferase family 4 protein [Thermococcus cleftensis]AFL94484.1 glycosyl transferase family protein 1 [Thermococcus cleftensis]
MESLKIAIASDWFYPKVGGIESHIDELARNLMNLGHQPHIITHDYRYMKPYIDSFPYPVDRFPASLYFRKYHVSVGFGQFWRINELYKRTNFDLTHVHSIYSPLAVAVSKISRGIRGVPVVATNHSFFGEPPLGKLVRAFVRHHLKKVDTFVAVSSPVAEDTRKLLGKDLNGRPVVVVPNGIDVRKWRPPEPEEREKARRELGVGDEIVILYLGRMTERKQAHRIPVMVKKALEKSGMSERKVRLVMIGNGPMRPVLEENLRRTGLGEIAELYDFMERGRLLPLYWAADLVLMPGILEAFPVVGLEAMATGNPVIGRNESGLSDMVVQGITGLLAVSEEEMAENLAKVFEEPELLVEMGACARERAERDFSWEVVLRRLLRIYRMTIEMGEEADRLYLAYKLMRRLS